MVSPTAKSGIINKCPKCGTNAQGKRTCCASNGAWKDECGDPGEDMEHTWFEGVEACQNNFVDFAAESQIKIMRNNSASPPAIPVFVANVEGRVNKNGYNEVSCMLILVTILINIMMF